MYSYLLDLATILGFSIAMFYTWTPIMDIFEKIKLDADITKDLSNLIKIQPQLQYYLLVVVLKRFE